jgi:hypothetical protein
MRRRSACRLWARLNYLDPKPCKDTKLALAAYQSKSFKQVGQGCRCCYCGPTTP